jgi:hypothetical protein
VCGRDERARALKRIKSRCAAPGHTVEKKNMEVDLPLDGHDGAILRVWLFRDVANIGCVVLVWARAAAAVAC